ncbi:type II CAAX prenyl endopeptidase Rce1 family protein [Lactococcus garvieae]|uniref:CPBP family glutamic-type intramembrane protease n=1 Tax=Lactococcus garvieae TaxID=1363 RepID=UPI0030D34CFC
MLEIFKTTKTNIWKFIIILCVLAIGDWGIMNGDSDGVISLFNFTFLAISALISLMILLGWSTIKRLFRKLRKEDWKWILFAIVADIILTYVFVFFGSFLKQPLANNSGVDEAFSLIDLVFSLPIMAISLAGEELFIATLFILTFIIANKYLTEKKTIILAVIISLSIFGLSHYTVYNGNIYQCLVIIGLGHIPTMYSWLKTETLWVPIIAHILYDVLLLSLSTLG